MGRLYFYFQECALSSPPVETSLTHPRDAGRRLVKNDTLTKAKRIARK